MLVPYFLCFGCAIGLGILIGLVGYIFASRFPLRELADRLKGDQFDE